MTDLVFPPHTTIFERMSRLAAHLGAINLGQGFPDHDGPLELREAAARAVMERSSQYPPMRGLPELRGAIAAYYAAEQGLSLIDDQVMVTSGATEALAASILALVEPGDDVILVQPLYDAYLPLVERAGGRARLVSLTPPDWTLSIAALEAVVTPATRVMILNTPNNPTGSLIDAATLTALGDFCVRHDILLICDEVWEAMLFDGRAHVSPLAVAALDERTVKIGSAGKIFSLTGWKVGWVCAAPPLIDRIAKQHQFLTFTTPPALQWAVAEGLALRADWHDEQRADYQRSRDRLSAGLQAAGYAVLPSGATWFLTVDLKASGILLDDVEFCERAVREAGVAAIPVSAFYAADADRGHVRLCFSKRDAVLDEAVARLAGFRQGLI